MYKVIVPGLGEVTCESVEALLELRDKFGLSDHSVASVHSAASLAGYPNVPQLKPPPSPIAPPTRPVIFSRAPWRRLHPSAKKLAEFLFTQEGRVFSSEDLRKVLEVSKVEGVGPSLRSYRQYFGEISIDLDQILQKSPAQPSTWLVISGDELRRLRKFKEENR